MPAGLELKSFSGGFRLLDANAVVEINGGAVARGGLIIASEYGFRAMRGSRLN
jgi:hypothetical protein